MEKEKTTLVIMAAGLGSRYGCGIKQLEPIGPNGEIIMDYSIHDAAEAGFDDFVIIIRKDIEEDFKEIIGNRIGKYVNVKYCFQDINDIPECYSVNGRTKPWGTGHAILSVKDLVKNKFAVINADDYYGKEAFVKMHDYLLDSKDNEFCMAGFILKNTLSENGGVSRGICKIDEKNNLLEVIETHNITRDTDIDLNSYVSMNMWGFSPKMFDYLEREFINFLDNLEEGDLKSEFLLPIIIDKLIYTEDVKVKLLSTNDKWFGVTYVTDKDYVIESMKDLIDSGYYAKKLTYKKTL